MDNKLGIETRQVWASWKLAMNLFHSLAPLIFYVLKPLSLFDANIFNVFCNLLLPKDSV